MVGAVEGSGKWIDVFKSRNIVLSMCGLLLCHDLRVRARRDGAELLLDYLKLTPRRWAS